MVPNSHKLPGGVAAAFLSLALLAAPLAVRAQQTPPAPSAPSTTAPAPSTAAPAPSGAAPSHATRARRSRTSRIESYITRLHAALKITPEQEDQWNKVAQVMRDNAAELDKLATERRQQRPTMSAVENLKSYERIADAHADELKKLVPAFSALYDSMSPDQKKNADHYFAQPHRTPTSRSKTTKG
jgi:periplasmic protein CpxP/Spy